MENKKFVINPKLRGEDNHKTFSIRIPDTLYNKLDNVSYKCNMCRNQLIKLSLEYALENLDIVNPQKE